MEELFCIISTTGRNYKIFSYTAGRKLQLIITVKNDKNNESKNRANRKKIRTLKYQEKESQKTDKGKQCFCNLVQNGQN
jgi:hypothetical protein